MARKRDSKGDFAAVQEPAPGDLRIIHAFVNTVDRRKETEELTSPRALGTWLAAQGLPGASAALTKADLRKAIEVREGLRALLAANSGLACDERAVQRLAKLAAQARYQVRVAGDGTARFQPVAQGFDAALARLLEIVVSAQVGGLWPRFKVCANDVCRGAFYDTSKNRSGKWCTSRRCGNQLAARKYRRSGWYRSLHYDED